MDTNANPPNPYRSETELVPGLNARPTFAAIAKIESLTGKSLVDLLRSANEGAAPSTSLCVNILAIGATAAGAKVGKVEEFGERLMASLGVVGIMTKAVEFLASSLTSGEAQEEAQGFPPATMEHKSP